MMHAYFLKTAYVHMLPVANSLVAIYEPSSAVKLFDQMPLRDHVSWTSVIGAASLPAQAVALFRRMLLAAVRVDGVVLVVLLRAPATLRDVRLGSSLHAHATRRGLLADVFVANSLVHMYSECLCLPSARNVFDSIADKNTVSWNTMLSGLLHADRCSEALRLLQSSTMPVKDVLSWNSMIGAFGMNGHASDALTLVEEMERDGAVKPNGVTLLALLSASAHGGLVREGVACLERLAREYYSARHLTCIVDMLARRGDVESAAEIAAGVGGPAAWSAVLSGCRTTTNKTSEVVGQEAARRVVELEPDNSAGYLMAATTSFVDNGAMRRTMRARGVEVIGGYSMAHVAGEEHRFASWDGRHPQRVQVYAMLRLLHHHMMRKPPQSPDDRAV